MVIIKCFSCHEKFNFEFNNGDDYETISLCPNCSAYNYI